MFICCKFEREVCFDCEGLEESFNLIIVYIENLMRKVVGRWGKEWVS